MAEQNTTPHASEKTTSQIETTSVTAATSTEAPSAAGDQDISSQKIEQTQNEDDKKNTMDDVKDADKADENSDVWIGNNVDNYKGTGDFLQDNAELIKRIKDILDFVYPGCGVTLAELLVSANEWIDKMKTTPEYLRLFAKTKWIRPVLVEDCPRESGDQSNIKDRNGKKIYHKAPTESDLKLGAKRKEDRVHAGNDYYVYSTNKKVYAITDGVVITNPYDFLYTKEVYENADGILFKKDAVEIKSSDGSDTTIRYCEIKFDPQIKKAHEVKKGDIIGEIIRNKSGEKKDRGGFMLHLEIYMGKDLSGNKIEGSLTKSPSPSKYLYVPTKNYKRREDLLDPEFINDLKDAQGN